MATITELNALTQLIYAALAAEWQEHADAARAEGWVLADCAGSENGPLQVQCIDSPEDFRGPDGSMPPSLEYDSVAWDIVKAGTGAHHSAALALLGRFNPAELALLLA